MEVLKKSLTNFIKRSIKAKQAGSSLNQEQINTIQKAMDMELPNWYVEMMLNYNLTNIEFTFLEDEYKSDIAISDYDTILSEINEAHPGLDIKPMGFVNFGTCLQGSGDPIFINLKENNNPAVIRIYHDGIIENEIIDENGGNKLADKLSDFFDNALFETY